jgi:hypothetical protein
VLNIKKAGVVIGETLDEQKGLIEGTTKAIEGNEQRLKKVNKRLDGLLRNISNCTLITVVFLQLTTIVAIFAVL